jgi:hypothetical protein
MSNHSEFFLHFGTGHPYDGEGIEIQTTVYQHRKKGGWFFDNDRGSVYWTNTDISTGIALGVMLIVLDVLDGHSEFEDSQDLYDLFKETYRCNPDEHLFDLRVPELDDSKVREFISHCGRYLLENEIKIVAVDLTANTEGLLKAEFTEFVQQHNLKNAQYCQATYTTQWGRFTGDYLPVK